SSSATASIRPAGPATCGTSSGRRVADVTGLAELDPATYVPHRLHGADRLFAETNCYVDVWIELLHAHGLEPAAMLAFCAAIDWEGDQWTFFKPPHADLEALYGVEIE